MWHRGDNGHGCQQGGAWPEEKREKETEHSSRMSQDREWRTEPTLFVLLTNRRKLTFGRLCEGVIVKKSAQHESPTLSLRISFFIRPFTSMFVSDGLSPVFKLAASMLGLNHWFICLFCDIFFSLCKSITQRQESVSLSSKRIKYLTNRHSILVEKAWNSKLFLWRLNIGILMKLWNIFSICWRKGWDEFGGCLIFSI